MADQRRISKKEFLQHAESIYGWELAEREREILIDLAMIHSGSVVLDNWDLFQKHSPGHPAWEFAEWFEILFEEEQCIV